MRRCLTAFLVFEALLVAGAPRSFSGDVSVSASIEPEVITLGDQATLVVTIKGKFRKSSKPILPPLDDFYVYDSGTSQNFSFVNGAVSSSVSYSFVLVPRREGKFTIAPIKFRIGDKEYTAEPVSLEVVKQSRAQQPPSRSRERQEGERAAAGRGFFITATIDRDTVFVNQQVTWTLHFYMDSRVNLVESPSFTPPEAKGFWVEDLPPLRKYYEDIQGRKYLVNELKRGYFPTAPGNYSIGPAQVRVTVEDFGFPSWDDLFNRSFSSFGFGKPTTLYTEKKKIAVLPLPLEGRPADFSGIVGHNIRISRSADKQVVQVGEPVNVVVEVSGEGNMKTAPSPKMEELRDFKVYQSGSSSNIYKKNYVVSGDKKYEYVLVPKSEGTKTLPPLKLSYFDPVEKSYRRASTSPLHLDVKPGAKEGTREIVYAGGGTDVEILGSDINYIHPVPAAISAGKGALYANKVFLALHLFPAMAVFCSLVIERKRKRRRENVAVSRKERAAGEAEKKLKSARKLIKKGNTEHAYAAIASALNGYISDKMNVSASGLRWEDVDCFLRQNGVDEEMIGGLRSIISKCDAARYAGRTADDNAAGEVAKQASRLIRNLEKRYL